MHQASRKIFFKEAPAIRCPITARRVARFFATFSGFAFGVPNSPAVRHPCITGSYLASRRFNPRSRQLELQRNLNLKCWLGPSYGRIPETYIYQVESGVWTILFIGPWFHGVSGAVFDPRPPAARAAPF